MFERRHPVNFPDRKQAQLNTTIDAAMNYLNPTMDEGQRRENQKLFATFHRAFKALKYQPSRVRTLVELGIGNAPCLPAVRTAFAPTNHIGIDVQDFASEIQTAYPSVPREGAGNLTYITADAKNPEAILRFPSPKNIDVILALNPVVLTEDEISREFTKPDKDALEMLSNWQQRLHPYGIMFITTYYPEEAIAILSDIHIRPYAYLYGLTGAHEVDRPNTYIIGLRARQRREEK